MPILTRIRSFLSSPQGRRVTDQGINMARNRGGRGGGRGRGVPPTRGGAGGRGGGLGSLLSLLRRR